MRSQGPTILQPTTGRLRRREVLHQRTHLRPVVEHGHDVPGHQEGLPILLIHRWEVEEVVIHPCFGILGEEAGDEVALAMHPALGRVFEHGRRRIPKEGGNDGVPATVHIVGIEPNLAPQLDGVLHLGRGEGKLTPDPLVVVLQRRGAQHQVLGPVGGHPARGRSRLDADAPGRIPIIRNLLRQRHELIPGLGNGIPRCLPIILGVPHQALGIEAMPHTAHHGFAVGPGHGGHV